MFLTAGAQGRVEPLEQFFLLGRIDGSWNVKSIIQVSPMREVDALRTLTRMREAGMVIPGENNE